MNCQNFESIVHDLAREQIMDASKREQASAHCDDCEFCARRLEDECALTFRLRALAAETRSAEAPALEAQLLAAFRRNRFANARPATTHQWRYRTAAAVVLMVFTIAGMRWRLLPTIWPPSAQNLASQPAPQQIETAETTAKAPILIEEATRIALPRKVASLSPKRIRIKPSPQAGGPLGDPGLAVPSGSTSGKGSNAVVPTEAASLVATNRSESEIATAFLPLGYTSPMNLQDGGQIVRVQLPRSALVAFGLPVNMDRYQEKVKADVFFGADGVARAIRFVQ